MRHRKILVAVAFIVYLFADWIYKGVPAENLVFSVEITDLSRYRSLLMSDYNSMGRILSVYVLPFTLGLWYCLGRDEEYRIIRFGSSGNYVRSVLGTLIFVASIFSIAHECIFGLMLVKDFSAGFIIENSGFCYLLIETLVLSVFYLDTGILFMIFDNLLKKRIYAMILIAAVSYIQYHLIYWTGLGWLPGKSVILPTICYSGNKRNMGWLLETIKVISLSVLLLMLFIKLQSEKDIMPYEK